MSAITFDNRAAFAYQLRLPTFEGPLDLLLKLIDRQHLPITDVSLVMVSDQFLAAARALGGANPESVAEFASVGSRLVLLKARSLLPRPTIDEEDDGQSELVVQLIEYRAIKLAATEFASLDRQGNAAFAKGLQAVDLPGKPVDLPLANHEPELLARAISRRLVSNRTISRLVAVRPMIPLRIMVDRLLDAIGSSRMTFRQIASYHCPSTQEERAMFLALLLLVRSNVVDAEQQEPFGEILVQRLVGADFAMTHDVEEM